MTRSKHVELIAGIGNGCTYSQSITIFNPAKIITIFIPIMYTVAPPFKGTGILVFI